ncbi:hypothetical protein GCM10009623_34880 [Nocardioides aestuarii]
MSAASARVVRVWVSRAIASSGSAYSRTAGVPSPPGDVIGSRSERGSPCITHQWATTRISATSAARRARTASWAASRTSCAERSSRDAVVDIAAVYSNICSNTRSDQLPAQSHHQVDAPSKQDASSMSVPAS